MMTFPLASVRCMRRLTREEGGTHREQKRDDMHQSVLVKEIIELLAPVKGETVLDATGGVGGHSEALLQAADIRLIALDSDPEAVARVRERLLAYDNVQVLESNFRYLSDTLTELGVEKIHKAIFDLGWNRNQLSQNKGFSFQNDEPLSMSYGTTPASGFTASDILNTWSEQAIADALFGYGEERYARRIAKAIVEARSRHAIETTGELVSIISSAVPVSYRRGRIHCATRTFQALRIAVNDELRALHEGIRSAWKMLAPQGRMAVISFHSIEDRIVKRLFLELAKEGGVLVTKKPIIASEAELKANPASRSAKLRVIEKT